MPPRKRLAERAVLQVLINQGVIIRCPKCGLVIDAGRGATREHLHQRATGGLELLDNFQFWCNACSARKSFGTKATSAGSDAHARAKGKRLANGGRKRGKSRKLQSRPFSKVKRPFRNRGGKHGSDVSPADRGR